MRLQQYQLLEGIRSKTKLEHVNSLVRGANTVNFLL